MNSIDSSADAGMYTVAGSEQSAVIEVGDNRRVRLWLLIKDAAATDGGAQVVPWAGDQLYRLDLRAGERCVLIPRQRNVTGGLDAHQLGCIQSITRL
ncbi:hypothetical protein E3T61_03035 [Cryobacterium lactosi]|uniref:Uncharacterized protein n=1 Tax=Cryobacterium lactosi TaxID=1259202 RepID=A0A4R9C0E0_9MICO|nr:hypothetical protein [Cryobacterium lactosi]TFD93989.1 hypothetical protein E3T61_03035 [Cryobacterium lactosi]